ncbi:MAG: MoaD/ThiS family protein [Acidobacteriota bacterium]|nr:MoaD/ThiS family protein [Acidobacteriota bacterium]
MKVKVKFFADFRSLFGAKEKDVELSPESRVRGLLDMLCDTPDRRAGVFDEREDLNRHVIVMRNGAPLPPSVGLETRLRDGDQVAVFPFIGGG